MSSNSRDRRRPAPTNSVRRLIVISERIAEAGVPERDAARRCEAGGARPPSPAPPRALRTKSRGEGRGGAGREARTRSSATLAAAPSPVPARRRVSARQPAPHDLHNAARRREPTGDTSLASKRGRSDVLTTPTELKDERSMMKRH